MRTFNVVFLKTIKMLLVHLSHLTDDLRRFCMFMLQHIVTCLLNCVCYKHHYSLTHSFLSLYPLNIGIACCLSRRVSAAVQSRWPADTDQVGFLWSLDDTHGADVWHCTYDTSLYRRQHRSSQRARCYILGTYLLSSCLHTCLRRKWGLIFFLSTTVVVDMCPIDAFNWRRAL